MVHLRHRACACMAEPLLALPVAFLRQWTRMVPACPSVRRFTVLNVFLRISSRFRAKKLQ
jgi:hypothetical protein